MLGHPARGVDLTDFDPDPAALENVQPQINRAMRANVLIETRIGWGGMGIGSGVILRMEHRGAGGYESARR